MSRATKAARARREAEIQACVKLSGKYAKEVDRAMMAYPETVVALRKAGEDLHSKFSHEQVEQIMATMMPVLDACCRDAAKPMDRVSGLLDRILCGPLSIRTVGDYLE